MESIGRSEIQNWFVMKSSQKFGPFGFSEVVSLMQKNLVFDFDYLWTEGLEAWTPLREVREFSVENIRTAHSAEMDVFQLRQHARALYTHPLYIHNDVQFWKGQTVTLSQQGALLSMQNPLLLPGQLISIHFRKQKADETTFNVTAEILSKRLTKERVHHGSYLQYAVKFNTVNAPGDELIAKWVQSQARHQKQKQSK